MRRSKASGLSSPVNADDLKVHLRLEPLGYRVLLVAGFSTGKDMWKFVRSVKVPAELAPEMVGSTRIQKNLEVITPDGTSYHALGFGGNGALMLRVHQLAFQQAGYSIADVTDEEVIVIGAEQKSFPITQCQGIAHNIHPMRGAVTGGGP